MLTQQDLLQIKKVVRGEIALESKTTRSELIHEIKITKHRLSEEISNLEDRLKNLEINSIELQKQIAKLNKSLLSHFNFLDKDFVALSMRIKDLEFHAGITPAV